MKNINAIVTSVILFFSFAFILVSIITASPFLITLHQHLLNIEDPQQEEITANIVQYLYNTEMKSQIPGFNPRENSHMKDVKLLLTYIQYIMFILFSLLLLLLPAQSFTAKKFLRVFSLTSIALLGLLFLIGVFFDAFFSLFHVLLFNPGSYVFNPDTDKIIQLYSPAFFSLMGITVWVVLLLITMTTFFLSLKASRNSS